MIGGDPLTGRDSELVQIRRALGGGGNYSGVVLVGAAGVGKTRLAREVLARATAAGDRTNWIVGTESARPLPLGAFTASISGAMSDLLPDVRRVVDSFVAQQRKGRVLLGVDDAHLLDGLSAHVVHQLAQARGVRLVVTMRTGGSEPDAVTALWKDGLLARLDLEPLSVNAVRSIIEDCLGGPVDARSAQRFWNLTGGNALFLRQLLKDQVAAGRIRQVAGVWMWDEGVAVSQNLGDMVGRELGGLTPEVVLVLDICRNANRWALTSCAIWRIRAMSRSPSRCTWSPLSVWPARCRPGWRTRCSVNFGVQPPERCICPGFAGGWRDAWRRMLTAICTPRCAGRCSHSSPTRRLTPRCCGCRTIRDDAVGSRPGRPFRHRGSRIRGG